MKRTLLILLITCATLVLMNTCDQFGNKPEQIAKKYCGSCHLFPEPSLLDKNTWEKNVLPEMAFRMGLTYEPLHSLPQRDIDEVVKTLPARPMVTEVQWKAIQDYYLQNAPDSISRITHRELAPLKQFHVSEFQVPPRSMPLITLMQYDSLSKKLFLGTRLAKLYQINSSFTLEDSFLLPSPPSDILFQSNTDHIISCIGIMDPNDQAAGRLIQLNTTTKTQTLLFDAIKRPVNFEMADLNNDSKNDFIVSAFGNYTGALLAYEKKNTSYQRHFIHNLPGTRKTIIKDVNNDGLKDIIALITQGDEQIILLLNEGKFKFRPQVLLRFPPVYGSSYFDLIDFNKDGNLDILYTNGDNADYSSILKSYHGIRIFLNNGENQFSEGWFYPMYGASQAVANDFDKDGDLDIAAISFFPDFKNYPEQSFIFFENNNGGLKPFFTPLATSSRWIVMTAADIDHDNDIDLLLGALNFTLGAPENTVMYWRRKNTTLLVLKNNLHSQK